MIQQFRSSLNNKLFLMFPNFSQRKLHKIYIDACVRTVIFNPDDGKQPKTFGLTFFNCTIFNLLALYMRYILSSEH